MKKTKSKKLEPLLPPDLYRCQCMKPNGHSFMTLGGMTGMERCKNKPDFVITDARPDGYGRQGSMSLCPECLVVALKQMPGSFTTEHIKTGQMPKKKK